MHVVLDPATNAVDMQEHAGSRGANGASATPRQAQWLSPPPLVVVAAADAITVAMVFSLAMPVSPSGVFRDFCFSLSGLSELRRSLDELCIFQFGPASFKYGRAEGSESWTETTKTPSTLQACSFFSNPFLDFCLSTPTFSSIILFHMIVVQTFDTLKVPVHRFETRDTLKKVICLGISQGLVSLIMQFSHESEHTYLMTSLIINLQLAVFYRQSLSCKVIDKSPRAKSDLNSSNSNYFPLCPPRSISIARLFFEISSNFPPRFKLSVC